MKYLGPIMVWIYLVVTTVAEVLVFEYSPGSFLVDTVIGIIALVNAVVTALFSMNIRKEPSAIHYLMLAPLVLVMVLILDLLFAFSH